MMPCWAYWASKKCTKNKPGIKAEESVLHFGFINSQLKSNVLLNMGNKLLLHSWLTLEAMADTNG